MNKLEEAIMNDFKAYASRALNESGETRDERWARHGSTKRISDREHVRRAIRYVLDGQGEQMSVWPETGR